MTTQPIADRPADEYGDDEFEEEPVEDEFEEMVVESVAQRTKAPPAMAHVPSTTLSPPPPLPKAEPPAASGGAAMTDWEEDPGGGPPLVARRSLGPDYKKGQECWGEVAGKIEYWYYTHKGGDGSGPKENQDYFFCFKLDADNMAWGVFDGHGSDNGRIASVAATRAAEAHLKTHFGRLRSEPQAVMTEAFEAAHTAVRAAILATEGVFERDGTLVFDVDESDWHLGYDAVDGGTTGSVAAVIDGRTLVYAAAGDSCAIMGADGTSDDQLLLVDEHSPTNEAEWASRLHKSGIHVRRPPGPDPNPPHLC